MYSEPLQAIDSDNYLFISQSFHKVTSLIFLFWESDTTIRTNYAMVYEQRKEDIKVNKNYKQVFEGCRHRKWSRSPHCIRRRSSQGTSARATNQVITRRDKMMYAALSC